MLNFSWGTALLATLVIAILCLPIAMIGAVAAWCIGKMLGMSPDFWMWTRYIYFGLLAISMFRLWWRFQKGRRFIFYYSRHWNVEPEVVDAAIATKVLDINLDYDNLSVAEFLFKVKWAVTKKKLDRLSRSKSA